MIDIQDLHYAYPAAPESDPSPWILRGVDLSIEHGECVALMGPTGAGKTTLALSLLGIVPQSLGGRVRGRVQVAGLDARRTPVPQLARRVGLVFQDPETQFLANTVEDEIAFGMESFGVPRAEMRRRIHATLGEVGMAGSEARTPHELSGGEKQRVALAAVLAMQPEVLVLDEPTANLDAKGADSVFSLLTELRQKGETTILLVSNEADQIEPMVDRVAVLADGRIRLDGEPGAVFAQADRFTEWGLSIPQLHSLAHCLSEITGEQITSPDLDSTVRAIARLLEDPSGSAP